jgi:hypothetical protein
VLAPAAGTPLVGGVASSTPAQPETVDDWRKRYEEAQGQLEQIQRKAEQDVRGVKSSLQSQIAALERQRDEERRAMETQINQLAVRGLDENGQLQYNYKVTQNRLTEREAELTRMQSELTTLQDVPRYISSFLALGVRPDKLVVDQGVDALLESGWHEVVTSLESLRQENETLRKGSGTIVPATNPAAPLGQMGLGAPMVPPQVASPSGGSAVMGNSWPQVLAAVSAQFGRPVTQEEVYRMVELQQLSPDIIPGLRGLS